MPKYTVTVQANAIITETTFTVEADNEDEARESAVEKAKRNLDEFQPSPDDLEATTVELIR